MSWADTVAVKTRAERLPAFATSTFVTVAPDGPPLVLPYLILHPSEGSDDATRFTSPAFTEHPEFTLHLVGASANQVQVLYGLLKPEFVTNGTMQPPIVAGRYNTAGYWRSPLPIQYESDVIPPLVFLVVELGWTSNPS